MNKFFFGFIPITVLAAVSLGMIIANFDPDEADGIIKFLFFSSFSIFLWGCGAIVFFLLNFFVHDRIADALRRGFFAAFLLLALIFLRKYNLLYWYTGFMAVIITMLFEFFIYKKAKLTMESKSGYLD